MADERIEDITGGELTAPAPDDLLVILDASDTTDDPQGTAKRIKYNTMSEGIADLTTCTGRLTLATGVYVTTTDQTAKATLYFTGPEGGNFRTWLYDGSANWTSFNVAEISLALSSLTTASNYDVFLYDNAGTATLELLIWTNRTTRATGLTTQDGVVVKSGDTTRRYLGTIRTTGTTTTEDSEAKRFVWNYYNRRKRKLKFVDTTSSWTYTTATWRQMRNSSANQVEFVIGIAGAGVDVSHGVATQNTVGTGRRVGFGIHSTTTVTTDGQVAFTQNTEIAGMFVRLAVNDLLGYYYIAALENSNASGTTTWYGTVGVDLSVGIRGWVEG